MNKLYNGGMDGGVWKRTHTGELPSGNVPFGWTAWWLEQLDVPHDPSNTVGYVKPEMKVIPRQEPYLDPLRIADGPQAVQCFTFWKIHQAGYYQPVFELEPGSVFHFRVKVHCWSSQDDDAHTSIHDNNIAVHLGVDENALSFTHEGDDGLPYYDPWSSRIDWSPGFNIYDEYVEISVSGVVGPSGTIVVFLKSDVKYPYKHCDVYWDTAQLIVVEEPEPVDWAFPVIARGSKVAHHCIHPDGVPNSLRRLAEQGALPGTTKSVDDIGWLVHDVENDPAVKSVLTVARIHSEWEGCGQLHDPNTTPQQMAAVLMGLISQKLDMAPELNKIDYWAPMNEPGGGGVSTSFYVKLAHTGIACMELADMMNIHLCLFDFNNGTPEWADMVAMAETDVFNQMFDAGHICGVHEGVWGNVEQDSGYGDLIPGAPVVEGAGSLCFRYKYLAAAAEEKGSYFPAVLVSEFYPAGGTNPVKNMDGISWYDELARADYMHLGFMPFTWGPTQQWEGEDRKYLTPYIEGHLATYKDDPNATPKEPQPEKCEGAARVPFASHRYVFDPNFMTAAEAIEWFTRLYSAGQWVTCGPNYDEAMMYAGMAYPDGTVSVTSHLVEVPRERQSEFTDFRDEHYPKVEVAFEYDEQPPLQKLQPIVGIHDYKGGAWCVSQRVEGCCLIPQIVETTPQQIDYRHLANEGIDVCVRLNWNYAQPEGQGTMPAPDKIGAHIQALAATIENAKGVAYWQIWNEVNNPREWPTGYALTPRYVLDSYNQLWQRLQGAYPIGLPTIDPKYGPGSNNREWSLYLMYEALGMGCIFSHTGKSQTNRAAEIWSNAKFEHDPLKWQYLHSKDMFNAMEDVPPNYEHVPFIMSELNPQFLTTIGGDLGWAEGNRQWVRQIYKLIRNWNARGKQQVTHAMIYRYEGDEWEIKGDTAILNAIRVEGKREE